jgi:uncharacterized protein (DUF342 family)
MESSLSKIQKSTEESVGADETQVRRFSILGRETRHGSTILNRLTRKLLSLKRKLKIKKGLGEKEIRNVLAASEIFFPGD